MKVTRYHIAGATAAVLAAATPLIANYEGLFTHAYKDSVGVTTICYGATNSDLKVRMGDTKTVAECKALLQSSLKKYDDGMVACLTRNIPDGMHVAFISFTYNVGIAGFCHSTVARKANAGDFVGACDALRAWNKGGGRVIKGLTNRRRDERRVCLIGAKEASSADAFKAKCKLTPWAKDCFNSYDGLQ